MHTIQESKNIIISKGNEVLEDKEVINSTNKQLGLVPNNNNLSLTDLVNILSTHALNDLPYTPSNVEEAYTTRETANGLNVVSGSYAEIQSIEGDTKAVDEHLYNSKVTSVISSNVDSEVIDTITPNIEVGKWQTIRKAVESDNVITPYVIDDNGATIIITNSFDIVDSDNRLPNTYRFSIRYNNLLNNQLGITNIGVFIETGTSSADYECVQVLNNNIFIRVLRNKLITQNLEGVKNFLSTNNIELRVIRTSNIITPLDINIQYKVSNGGTETITNNNAQYAAIATIDTKYMVKN